LRVEALPRAAAPGLVLGWLPALAGGVFFSGSWKEVRVTKKVVCFGCFCGVLGVGVGRLFDRLPPQAEAGGGNPLPACQDLNGDGSSDASS